MNIQDPVFHCQLCAADIPTIGHKCNCQGKQKEAERIRKFNTGAMRDTDQDKLDYESFLSPLVLERYAQYLHKNRKMKDGTMRDGDNWQKGIPITAYMKSGWRHLMDWWTIHRYRLEREITSYGEQDQLEEAICAVIFNASGYLHESLKKPLFLQPAEAVTEEYPPYPDPYEGIVNAENTGLPPPPPTYGWDE